MLTPEQAELMRQEQVMLEYAEMDQAKAQEKMNRFYDSIESVYDTMKSATPEQKEKMAQIVMKLVEGYRTAERERGSAEDKYRQHAAKIREYEQLDAQQVEQTPQAKRRVIYPDKTNDQLRLEQYLGAGYVIGDDGLVYTPSGEMVNQNGYNMNSSGAFVPATETVTPIVTEPVVDTSAFTPAINAQRIQYPNPQINQDIIDTNVGVGGNISNPYLYGGESVPQEIRDARYAYMNNGAFSSGRRKAANALRNQGYTVGFGGAVRNGGGAGGIYRLNPVPSAFGYGRTASGAYDYAD